MTTTTIPSAPQNEQAWATLTFGDAQLGDRRRTARLIQIAAAAAQAPAGRMTEIFTHPKSRLAAYRFFENPAITDTALAQSIQRACVQQCSEQTLVYVPVDQSSLTLPDRCQSKGLGAVGTYQRGCRGLQVVSALAVSLDDVPQGVVTQHYWCRPVRPRRVRKRPRGGKLALRKKWRRNERLHRRRAQHKESYVFVQTIQQVCEAFAQPDKGALPWIQLDRAGDCWSVLLEASQQRCFFTIRSSVNRCIQGQPEGTPPGHLWDHLEKQEPVGTMQLHVPARPQQLEREAVLSLRVAPVMLDLKEARTGRKHSIMLWAVWVQEEMAPSGQDPLHWVLLTNYPVAGQYERAARVVLGYSRRWTVEDFHRTWKKGSCHVEDTQLQRVERVVKWARVLGAVAMRVQGLMHRSRVEPHVPATAELSQQEIDAAILLHGRSPYQPGDTPGLEEVVGLIAEVGGYTGKSSGGPPGMIVLTRGLKKVEAVAEALRNLAKLQRTQGRYRDKKM